MDKRGLASSRLRSHEPVSYTTNLSNAYAALIRGESYSHGSASKLREQWSQRLDDAFMRDAIAGNHAVAILHFDLVVAQRLAEQVGYDARLPHAK